MISELVDALNSQDIKDTGKTPPRVSFAAEQLEDDVMLHSPADLRRAFSQRMSRSKEHKGATTDTPDSKPSTKKRNVNICNIAYNVPRLLAHKTTRSGQPLFSLVDRGANGGVAGDDVCVIEETGRRVDIEGIDQHQVNNIPICTVGGVVTTSDGEQVIAVLGEYAWVGKGPSIHSSGQLEHHGNYVCDKSYAIGGKQMIRTTCGRIIPLAFQNGLPRLPIRTFTKDELETLPQVILTMSGKPWDPTVLDTSRSDRNALQRLYDREPGFDTMEISMSTEIYVTLVIYSINLSTA